MTLFISYITPTSSVDNYIIIHSHLPSFCLPPHYKTFKIVLHFHEGWKFSSSLVSEFLTFIPLTTFLTSHTTHFNLSFTLPLLVFFKLIICHPEVFSSPSKECRDVAFAGCVADDMLALSYPLSQGCKLKLWGTPMVYL